MVNLLKKNSRAPFGGKCLSHLRHPAVHFSFLSLSHSLADNRVEKCCARWSRAGNFFYLFISTNFSRVSSQITRLYVHLYVFHFLTNFTGIVVTRRGRRARVSMFAVSSLARFLFLCGPPMFLRSRDPIDICILKQQIRLGYALIIHIATGTTYSEVKVAGHDRAEPFSL